MSLTFYPKYGTVLICDFNTGFYPPEMVKKRPVVVVSPRKRVGADVVTIVPLSTSKPSILHKWHFGIDTSILPFHFRAKDTWAKCDMITSVGLWRLDRMKEKVDGKRVYTAPTLAASDLAAIQLGIKAHLNLT